MILDKKQMIEEDIKLNYNHACYQQEWMDEWRQHHHGGEDHG